MRSAALTHVGRVRTLNEDAIAERPEIGLWAIADGMGGHGGGDVASQEIVASLNALPTPGSAAALLASLESSLVDVNGRLRAIAKTQRRALIGAAFASLLIYGRHFACVWCGDSRVYRLRSGVLTQLSHDHSEVQELLDRGVLDAAEAKTWPRRNVITRALGASDQIELEIVDGALQDGDRFLICSDGLTAHVEDPEISAWLGGHEPAGACQALVALTLERGASDNVSVIVVVWGDEGRTVRIAAHER